MDEEAEDAVDPATLDSAAFVSGVGEEDGVEGVKADAV